MVVIDFTAIIPGYQGSHLAGDSFAPRLSVGSTLFVHEEFMWRALPRPGHLGSKPVYDGKYDGFPCIPVQTVKDAIEFHRRAVSHMCGDGNVRPYVIGGEEVLSHDVFNHFREFVTPWPSRFTNDTTDHLDPFIREYGLRFYPDGWDNPNVVPEPLGPSELRR
jgi:hypothetical protein